jgi:hypothetical protein|tara:strand:- start:381 stop:650 length:270 start_codon:yes stop_codon:yes gene_type:complete
MKTKIFAGRTKRLRNAIIKFLKDKDQADTADIYEHIKRNTYWGESMMRISNVLSKDPRFELVGETRRAMGMHSLQIYKLADDYQEYEVK